MRIVRLQIPCFSVWFLSELSKCRQATGRVGRGRGQGWRFWFLRGAGAHLTSSDGRGGTGGRGAAEHVCELDALEHGSDT